MSKRANAIMAEARAALPGRDLLAVTVGIGDIAAARTIIEGRLATSTSAATTISLTTAFRAIESDAEVRRRLAAIPIERGDTKAKQALAEAEAELAAPRVSHVFKPRDVIETAEAHVQNGKLALALRAVEKFDRADQARRKKYDEGRRLLPEYRRLALVAFAAGDPVYAHELIYDICERPRRGLVEERVFAGGRVTPTPATLALAARAFANFGERDEAERLATEVPLTRELELEVTADLVNAWIEIDRERSLDRALACARQIESDGARCQALVLVAQYAHRIDDLGHEPLADDAPQSPLRLPLLDSDGHMLPKPKRKTPARAKKR